MIYLDEILLPITPSKLDMKINNKNKSIDLASGQEINIIKEVGLTTIALDILLPYGYLPFAHYDEGFKPPEYFLRKFDEMKKKTFQFIVLRDGYNTNLTVTLEGYRIIEDAKDGRDIKVSINLKQYVHFGERKITVERATPEDEPAVDVVIVEEEVRIESPPDVGEYITKVGDTLWSIAKILFGNGDLYPLISGYNNIKYVNKIPVGTVLKIPYKIIEENT